MAHQDVLSRETKSSQYPHDPNSYEILNEIGRGCTAIVYKALCITTCSVVAIKSIDLDRSKTDDFDNIRREAKTMSLLSHPNVLKAHCSFTVGRRLWVVMPFMSAGSIQSIIATSFPNGISESCISIILKETLMGLCYLHDQGHLHRDIKAGNILMDSNGSIKLADFGVSASIYESSSRCLMLNEITGTFYWMAPEVIHSYNGYSYKADIWSFGITALELAQGKPPLSHLPFSESLVMKITKGLRFSDYMKEEEKGNKNPRLSKYFKDMVGLCLDQDPLKRPSATKLLKHYFFKNCKGCDFLVKNLLQGLPSVELRFKDIKIQRVGSISKAQRDDDSEEDIEESFIGSNVKKHRRISGWNFSLNANCDQMDPVFPVNDTITSSVLLDQGLSVHKSHQDDDFVKQLAYAGGNAISEKEGDFDVNKASSPSAVTSGGGEAVDISFGSNGVDRETVVRSLTTLKKSLDEQRDKVKLMLAMVGAEETRGNDHNSHGGDNGSKEEHLMQVIEKLRMELENEKKKRSNLEMELEFLKLHITSTSDV